MNTINIKNRVIAFVVSAALVVPLLISPSGAFAQSKKDRPPVIHGISSPTVLAVNTSGTWTVKASDPENGNLSYSVDWGDDEDTNPNSLSILKNDFVQSSSFSHAYANAGTYTVKFMVEDSAGQTAVSSVTVRVGSVAGQQTLTISDLKASAIHKNQALITWKTNARSDSKVWVSTVSPVDTSVPPSATHSNKNRNNRQGSMHSVVVNKLEPGTTYYVVVKSSNKNTSVTSSQISFTTPASAANSAPTIISVNGPTSLTTNTSGTWTLTASDPKNTALTYDVDWGDVGLLQSLTSLINKKPVFVQTSTFSHAYEYAGTYTITFKVKNAAGKVAQKTATVTVTGTPVDTTPPVISNISTVSSTSNTSTTINWTTNESADSRVWYGMSNVIDTTQAPTIVNVSLSTIHSLTLTNLATSTTFYAVIGSKDAAGNMSTSSLISFVTGASI